MSFGINTEKFLAKWAIEHTDDLVDSFDKILSDDNLSKNEIIKALYVKNLSFMFAVMTEVINENNIVIEKQLRKAGVKLPYFD